MTKSIIHNNQMLGSLSIY